MLLQVFVFAFGAVIGSFLNAVLWRLRTGESVVVGRSYCPHCHHGLGFFDLFPIISFMLLGGRCRYCRAGIHHSYFLVELAAGAMFLLAARNDLGVASAIAATDIASLLLHWSASAVLLLIFVYDARYMLVPRKITLVAAALAFAANAALGHDPLSLALGVFFAGGFFQLQYVVSGGRWVGGGDALIGIFMGALLGFKLALAAMFFAYVIGALVGLALIGFKRKTLKSQVAFGTFLSVATFAMMLYGEAIIRGYVAFLGI